MIRVGITVGVLCLALCAAPRAVAVVSSTPETGTERDEELLDLLRFQSSRIATATSAGRSTLRYGLDLTAGRGWEDNVFHASPDLAEDDFGTRGRGDSHFGRDDLKQGDFFQHYELDAFVDIPLGGPWSLETEETLSVQEFDSLHSADREWLELEAELHYAPSREWNLYLGTQFIRRLAVGTNALGTRFISELDYYRYDGYAGIVRRFSRNNSVEVVYRHLVKDYDETTGQLSDDYTEDRFRVSWRHRFSQTLRSSLYGEVRLRDYDEEEARDRLAFRIPGELRERRTWLVGADAYWKLPTAGVLHAEIDLEKAHDPFERYYDYAGGKLGVEWSQPLPGRFYLELDGSAEARHYPLRRFLRFGPDPRIKRYRVYRLEGILGREITDRLDLQLKYEGRWLDTSDDREDYDVNRVQLQLSFAL